MKNSLIYLFSVEKAERNFSSHGRSYMEHGIESRLCRLPEKLSETIDYRVFMLIYCFVILKFM